MISVSFLLLHAGPTGHVHGSDWFALGGLALAFVLSIILQARGRL